MRPVKGNLSHSSKKWCKELEGSCLGQGRVLARPEWAGEKMRAVKDGCLLPLERLKNQKRLARRPHVDQQGALPKSGKVNARGKRPDRARRT
jgi:hypothetical protein